MVVVRSEWGTDPCMRRIGMEPKRPSEDWEEEEGRMRGQELKRSRW